MWEVLNIVAQYATIAGAPTNTTSNIFFNADTMEPLCNTPGWIESFRRIQELTKFARDNASATFNSTPYIAAALVYLCMTVPLTRLSATLEMRGKRGNR